ncbi:MAG: cytochrome ubiquinol oxidase subunit I [Hyphomicrobiaceae bacterium]|nr:cytochrome ubiquinol oxidase subunit I [Hyphomicrobiaceae bacterium]
MDVSALDLARLQFAFTVSAHIFFPAFTIGLASYLAVLEGLWLLTGRDVYMQLFRYWLVIFALTFGMGVVSGVVMSYQFGTNWSVFSDKTGPVLGPLMGYEVLSAFFLEAGFLGVMLFGLRRVGRGLHFFATLMVAAGTLLSAFWILSANSWMHTPAGYAMNDKGQFVPTDWWAVIFNPSFPYRLVHMVLAAYLTTAFVVGAVGAWHLLRDRSNEPARLMMSMALWMAALVTPVQIFAGDLHGLNTLEHQPMKVAAIEGHYETRRGAPLVLLGWPDNAAGQVRYAVEVPKLGSLILTHDLEGEIRGLKAFPRADWPSTPLVFWSFRIMVAIGFAMLAVGIWSLVARWRGGLANAAALQRACVMMGPSGFAAVLAGWITTEAGRQPYTVYGLLRTADSVSPVAAPAVASSLIAFVLVYLAVFGTGTLYTLRLMARAPGPLAEGPHVDEPVRAAGIVPGPAQVVPRAPGAADR